MSLRPGAEISSRGPASATFLLAHSRRRHSRTVPAVPPSTTPLAPRTCSRPTTSDETRDRASARRRRPEPAFNRLQKPTRHSRQARRSAQRKGRGSRTRSEEGDAARESLAEQRSLSSVDVQPTAPAYERKDRSTPTAEESSQLVWRPSLDFACSAASTPSRPTLHLRLHLHRYLHRTRPLVSHLIHRFGPISLLDAL